MSLLKLLKENHSSDSISLKIKTLEEDFGFELAPVMKSFYLIYSIELSDYSHFLYYNSDYGTILPFYSLTYVPNPEIQVESFFNLENVYGIAKKVYRKDHIFWSQKLVPIAECFDQGYLLVDCSEKGMNNLFIEYGHKDNLELVANNIFEYCSNCKISFSSNDLPDGRDLKDLYKNWGEDFWRLTDS